MWFLGASFWLMPAPAIFLAGSRFVSTPLTLILIGFRVSVETMEIARWIIAVPSWGFGVWLVWIVWKQAKGYAANRAA